MSFLLNSPLQPLPTFNKLTSSKMENKTLAAILGMLALLVISGLLFIDVTSSIVKNSTVKADSANIRAAGDRLTGF